MIIALAPGESLLPGTSEAIGALFDDPRIGAILLPLVPQGAGALPRAARRYLAAWDRRFLHPQNFYAPATRVATRTAPAGWRNAEAAPQLASLLATGARIEALTEGALGVASGIGRDLGAWNAHFRAEGEAWGALARRDPTYARFLPPQWWRHNLAQLGRRVIEEAQAVRSPAPLPLLLHLARESAFSAGASALRR